MNNHEQEFKAVCKTMKNNRVMVDTREDGIYVRLAGSESKGEAFSLEWARVLSFPQEEVKLKTVYDDVYDDQSPDYIKSYQEEI